MIFVPSSATPGNIPASLPTALPCTPYIFGIDGPVISASRIPTEYPCCTIIRARDAVTIDLPTPPLPLTTPITFFTCEYGFAGAFRSFFALLHEPACAQEEHDSGEHPLFCSSAITPNLLIFRIYKSYSSTTAITSISQRRFFGSVFTATQLLAGFDVKYFA